MSGNAKQRRAARRKRIRELDALGKAYAVMNGKLDEDVELRELSKTHERTPVTLDGETHEPIPESKDEKPANVSGEMFQELLNLWKPFFNQNAP